METKADIVCEASWEVCNKCGGIHTVITSKASLMQAHYDTFYFVGPLFDYLPRDFIPQAPPETLSVVFERLYAHGIRCEYGFWDIESRPATILVDAKSLEVHLDSIKKGLWDAYGIDSLNASHDFHEPLLWSWGVGMLLEEFEKVYSGKRIVGHFHEWLSGFAMFHLNNLGSSVAKVFTTHATMLGRSLSSRGTWLFDVLENIDPEHEAKAIGIADKFTTERACAHVADVFTTVSETTAREAEHLLGREPMVLPNGLSLDKFPTFEEASMNHKMSKRKLQDYLMAHFFPYRDPGTGEDNVFDFSQTLFFYTSGRYEFENKGIDVTIKALGRLNEQLKDAGSGKNIVAFFFLAIEGASPKQELLENKSYLGELASEIEEQSDVFTRRFIMDVLSHDEFDVEPLPEAVLDRLKRDFSSVKRHSYPPLSTHVIDEKNDSIISSCRENGLNNHSDDKVKVVFLPAYLDGRDGLLNMTYYEAVAGCHLGIFPSYYEPWGYTPLESLAHGVPAITSSLTGYGQYMKDKVVGTKKGLHVVEWSRDKDGVVDSLYNIFLSFSALDTNARVARKINAHALSSYADWRQLIRHYLDAHNKALENKS
ncbi:MAG: glycosyltransferase [Candidatus Woesearchaeota archaeon]